VETSGGKQHRCQRLHITVYDPGLFREQEMSLLIEKNWFLAQKIPVGGFVRNLYFSQVWQEQVDETRIITTEGLTTCLDLDEDGHSRAGDRIF